VVITIFRAVDLNDPSSLHAFLVSLFNSNAFRSSFRRYSSTSRTLELLPNNINVSKVNFKPVPTSLTDLHIFDRLWTEEPSIVNGSVQDPLPSLEEKSAPTSVKGKSAAAAAALEREAEESSATGSGAIRKCFEDQIDGIPIADELRKCLLDRDADTYEIFTPAERQQLLFILFTHLCVGGGLCQYENNVRPYLSVLRLLYRDLVSIRTNRNTDQVEIASLVYRVNNIVQAGVGGAAESPVSIFGDKEKDKHHLCIISIDPHKRHITSYYFAHTSAW
jgi:hypothetical protein